MFYACDLCDKVFNYPAILEIHYRSHTGEKPYKCKLCKKNFSHEAHVFAHMRSHFQKKQYLPENPNSVFPLNSAPDHTELHRDEGKNKTCVKDSFPDENGLANQNIILEQKKQQSCVVSSEVFSKACDLNLHRQKENICGILDAAFLQKSAAEVHTESYIDKRKDKACLKASFPDENGLEENHLPTYVCVICNKVFSRECNLKRHSKIHTPNLNTHERVHTKDELLICEKIFLMKSALTAHSRVHKEKEPFICEICGKVCSKKSSLTSHKRVHAKNFICDTCGKSFVWKCDLNVHYRVHTKEKPYNCVMCGRSFSQISVLKVHHRIHTGEKPFECDICGKAFRQVANLKHHLRTKH